MALFPGLGCPEVETIKHQIQPASKEARDVATSSDMPFTKLSKTRAVPEVLTAMGEEERIADPLERFVQELHAHEMLACNLQSDRTSMGETLDCSSPEIAHAQPSSSSDAPSPSSSITVGQEGLNITDSHIRKYEGLNKALELAGYGSMILMYRRHVIPFHIVLPSESMRLTPKQRTRYEQSGKTARGESSEDAYTSCEESSQAG